MKRIGSILLAVLIMPVLLGAWVIPVAADDMAESSPTETMPSAYTDVKEHLPDDLVGLLPDGMFSEDPEEAIAAVTEAAGLGYLTSAVLDALGLRLGDALALLCTMIGLLLMAGVLRLLRDTIGGKGGEIVGFVMRLVIFTAIIGQAAGMLSLVVGYFDQLRELTVGMIPAMGTLYAIGGNVGQAALNGELLMIFVNLLQYIGTGLTPPFCGVCLSLALLDAFGHQVRLAPLGALIKKWYSAILGLMMFLLTTVLSVQSVLTSRADTLAMRGIKYAVGSWIPVVGGAVSGTMGTVAAVVGSLRGIGGTCGIVLTVLLLMPTLVQVLLFRWMFGLSSTVAGMLGCDGESGLLIEMGSLYGYLAAAITVSALLFVLALGLLIGSAPAFG